MWREGQLDVDFIVSSEVETAYAISRTIGVPAARQTDLFAEGQVQLVEFEVDERASATLVGAPLRETKLPADSRVAAIIRGDEMRLPGRRRRDRRRRPDRRDRVAPRGAGMGRADRPGHREGGRRRHLRRRPRRDGDRAAAARAGHRRAHDRGVARAGADRRRRAAPRPHLPLDRLRPRLPRAGANRGRPGLDLRDARRHEEPLRRHARQGARRALHDRDRARRARRWRCSSRPGSTSRSTRAR